MNHVWKVNAGSKVKLKDYNQGFTGRYTDRISSYQELQAPSNQLYELQELLAAAQKKSLLVVLQGIDTSGKDGTIRHVLSHVNPQGCFVHSFKAPTQEELSHDFLMAHT
jgi:polyphosphate kinase 2 (PPK2 family)